MKIKQTLVFFNFNKIPETKYAFGVFSFDIGSKPYTRDVRRSHIITNTTYILKPMSSSQKELNWQKTDANKKIINK